MRIISKNITKYSAGGTTSGVLFVPIPLLSLDIADASAGLEQAVAPTKTAGALESNKFQEAIDKKMVDMLEDKGLWSDVLVFLKEYSKFEQSADLPSFAQPSTTAKYYMILGQLPKIRLEYDDLKNAVDKSLQEFTFNEIAINSDGSVFVVNTKTGKFSSKLLDQVDETDRIITNSELAKYRKNSVSFAFNSDVAGVIANGVSVQKIATYILSIVDKLGKTTIESEGYSSKAGNLITKGLEVLQSLGISSLQLGVDGTYKLHGKSESQLALAKAAINWIIGSLPKNMLTLLQYKVRNMEGNPRENAQNLIIQLITSHMSNFQSNSIDLIAGWDGLGERYSEKDPNKDGNLTLGPTEALVSGRGYSNWFTINAGTADNFNVYGNQSVLVDSSGNPLGPGTLASVFLGQLATALDINSVTMGGVHITPAMMSKVALDGNKVVAIELPVDKEQAQKGIIAPDLKAIAKKEQVDKIIQQRNITDIKQINQLYQNAGLPFLYNDNGTLNTNEYQRFGVISAYAEERAFEDDISLSDDYVEEVKDENTKEAIAQSLKKDNDKYDYSKSGWVFSGTHFYKGSIFVPIVNDPINTSLGSKNYMVIPHANNSNTYIQRLYDDRKESGYVNPGSLSTNMN